MGKPTGFLELDREAGAMDVIPPLEQIADFGVVDEALARLGQR